MWLDFQPAFHNIPVGRVFQSPSDLCLSQRECYRFDIVGVEPTGWTDTMKADQLNDVFDSGADLLAQRRGGLTCGKKRVNVDLPTWMIENLDREADRVGVTRQSIIKVWLA